MDVDRITGRCQRCGKPLPHSRHGGQRKRFCSSSCRSAWHRAAKPDPGVAPAAAPPILGRLVADLEWVWGLLVADVRAGGVRLADGRLNPSVGELRRLADTLARLAPPAEMEADDPLGEFRGPLLVG